MSSLHLSVLKRPAALRSVAGARALRAQPPVARVVRARASEQRNDAASTASTETSTSQSETVFYGGATYTNAEWEEALRQGVIEKNLSQRLSGDGTVDTTTFGDVMAFSGPAPEIINGRLAMLGFISAMAAELRTDQPVLQQWGQEPTLIALTFLLFMAGSLAPIFAGKEDSLGPFTPEAEMLNGRAAMIGFASVLVAEAVRGCAFI